MVEFNEWMERRIVLPESRKHLENQIYNLKPNFFVSLAFNRASISPYSGEKALKNFIWDLDRKLSGKMCYTKPELRLDGIAIPEKWETHPHYHCLIHVPPHAINRFVYRATKFWQRGPMGQSRTIKIREIDELSQLIRYVTKSVFYEHHLHEVIYFRNLRNEK